MAFTVDLTTDEGISLPWSGHDKHFVLKKTVDFSVAANKLTTDRYMALFDIPGGVLVTEVIVKVTTNADSDCDDLNVGSFEADATPIIADGFIDGGTVYASTAPAYLRDPAGETYSINNGTVGFVRATDWVLGCENQDAHDLVKGVFTFIAICEDLRF